MKKFLANLKLIIVLLLVFILGFRAGMKTERLLYKDTCLDMGDGKNPVATPFVC